MNSEPSMLVIREMTMGEEKICADIFTCAWNRTFPNRPRKIRVKEFVMQTKNELVLIAEKNKKIIGFIAWYEPESFIHHLFIDPKFHRQGVGTKSIQEIIAKTKDAGISLKCNVENLGALSFYKAHQFKTTEEVGEDEFGPWIKLFRSGNF